MKYRHNSEFDKEKKIHKVVKNKEQKYRKIPYEYLDEEDPDEGLDDEYTVDEDTKT